MKLFKKEHRNGSNRRGDSFRKWKKEEPDIQSERGWPRPSAVSWDMGESNFKKEKKPYASEVEEDKELMGSSGLGTRR